MNSKEEKQFETSLDLLIEYAKNIKISLQVFMSKIDAEGPRLDYGQVLDSFSSVCGQINTLMRFTRANKATFFGNRVVLPRIVSPDKDESLLQLTEGRVPVVNHEMVPDYLRTMPDPDIEEIERALTTKAASMSVDAATKQVHSVMRLIMSLESIINGVKQTVTIDQDKKPTYLQSETEEMIAAMTYGVGIVSDPSTSKVKKIELSGYVAPTSSTTPSKTNPKAPELKTNII